MYFDKKTGTYKSSILKGVFHGFGTKNTGDGRDIETVKLLFEKERIRYKSLVIPKQCHSTNVKIIQNSSECVQYIGSCDGLVTREKRVILTVITADCVPIIYFDRRKQIIGISHGGWKGTLEKIAVSVIEKMEELGSARIDIQVVIGPAIGPCCYEIYGARLKMFQKTFSDEIFRREDETFYLDLYEANKELLIQAGIRVGNIDIMTDSCTSCNPEIFYSYYRDKELIGEMTSYIMLP